MIRAVGDEIFGNKEKILGGTYKRKTQEITAVHTAPRGLDFMQKGSPTILAIDKNKVEPSYTQALNEFNNTKRGNDCVNCTTVQPARKN